MNLHHVRFFEIPSTHKWLMENVALLRASGHQDILVSTEKQTAGIGRQGNCWYQTEHALAFSFTIAPDAVPTLTPLEIGVLLAQYFKEKFRIQLKLKWPNDLLDESLGKCGGIISQYVDDRCVVVGVGLNLYRGALDARIALDYPMGYVSAHAISVDVEDLTQYLLTHRLVEVAPQWMTYSAHQGLQVRIADGEMTWSGKFTGLGQNGEAVLDNDGKIQLISAGQLRIS